jgi:LacI family transcriptional regulator
MSDAVLEFALPRVLLDGRAIGRLGAEHLMARGCERLVFFLSHKRADVEHRCAGFKEAVDRAGLRFILLNAPADGIQGATAVDEWLATKLPTIDVPFGAMACSDIAAARLLDTCLRLGFSVPEQVLILGADNDDLTCDFEPVPLSSIDGNRKRHGYEAARLLDQLMQGEPAPDGPIMIPPGPVVTRQSTNMLAISHPVVALAVSFIWQHYTETSLRPPEVASHVHMSREVLHRHFVKHVGRSVAAEIRHKRRLHAQQLLQSTNKTLEEIAELSGFSGPVQMHRVFRRELDTSPGACRGLPMDELAGTGDTRT